MPSVKLNEEEIAALAGLPYLHRCLYMFGIRQYMDYATGISGIKRKISWQSICEELYIEPGHRLEESGTPKKERVRKAAKKLERQGIIKTLSEEKRLIFECVLASQDNSAQNNKDTIRTRHKDIAEEENNLDKSVSYVNVNQHKDIHKNENKDIPPVSGIYTTTDTGAWKKFFEKLGFGFNALTDSKVNGLCLYLCENQVNEDEVMAIITHVNSRANKHITTPAYYAAAIQDFIEAKKNPTLLQANSGSMTTRGANYEAGKRTRQQELNDATAARAAKSFGLLQRRQERQR